MKTDIFYAVQKSRDLMKAPEGALVVFAGNIYRLMNGEVRWVSVAPPWMIINFGTAH